MPAGAPYFEPTYHPLANATTVAEVEALELAPVTEAELAWMQAEGRRLRATTDRAIMGHTGYNVYEGAQQLRGWEQFMVDLGSNPELAQAILQKQADHACENLTRVLGAVGEYIDIVQTGDDLGTQGGPQLSPRMYRNLVKPYQKQVYAHIKALCDKPLFLHSCGGIYPLLPDLIEAGVNIINPVQFTAAGMEAVRLKREFGRDLVFWGGGCDTQHILPEASPAEVRDHVRRQIEIFAPGGGFVFNQVHNIQSGVPAENIIAMLDAAYTYG
jgi:uroporphyrinogen decarboxylase